MSRQPEEYTLEVVAEATFGTEPSWSGELMMVANEVDPGNWHPSEIDDPTDTVAGGENQTIEGPVWSNGAVSLPVKLEGLRAVAADTAAAVPTFQTKLWKACFQEETLLKRAKASGSPTTVEVVEDLSDAHLPGGAATGGIGLAPFYVTSTTKTYVRPYTYTAASETMALKMELPAAPAATDPIYAGALYRMQRIPSTLTSLAMRAIGHETDQNVSPRGIVTTCEVTQLQADQVPLANFQLFASASTWNVADTRPAHAVPLGRVFAGGEVLIAPYGDTDVVALPGRVTSIKCGGTWTPDHDPNGALTGNGGLRGWLRGSDPIAEIVIHIPSDVLPTAVGDPALTSASWLAAWTGATENAFHLLVSSGQGQPGYGAAFYMPHCRLRKPTRSKDDKYSGYDLVFRSFDILATVAGQAEPAIMALIW